ncbi:MAG: putative toxin-antitoxin system toxin component, PIN family [Anaerolineae bacterium]|nr:putative toxin-antitoxin system toxin component, PIN family [Anaerolineae bacterium]
MRVVLDTNVWVSGLLWRGLPWKLLCLAEEGEVEICTTPAALMELEEVLAYERFQPRLAQLGLTPAELVAYAMTLASIFEVPEGEPIVFDDPNDDVFVRCAVAADAVCIISGDHHLLNLGSYSGIPILTVRDFFAKMFPRFLEQR